MNIVAFVTNFFSLISKLDHITEKSLREYLSDRLLDMAGLDWYDRLEPEVQVELQYFERHRANLEASMEPEFMAGLLASVLAIEDVEGDIIELGTYKGGSTIMLARLLMRVNSSKEIYACDTFEGFPYDDRYGFLTEGENADTSMQYVEQKFRRFRVSDRIHLAQGRFEDVLEAQLGDKKYSYAFIDCDMYQSTKHALNYTLPRIVDGGLIVFNDYHLSNHGLMRAVHEICEQRGYKVNLFFKTISLAHIQINNN